MRISMWDRILRQAEDGSGSGSGSGSALGGSGGSEGSGGLPPPTGGLQDAPEDNDFDAAGMDSIEISDVGTGAQPGARAPAATQGAQQSPQQRQASAPAQQPVQQPVQQRPAGATQQAPEPQPAREPTIEQIRAGLTQNHDALVGHLAQTTFQLSPAEVEALETDAVAAIPRLLARTAIAAANSSLGQIQKLVPQLVQQALMSHDTGREAEGQFYAAWPQLNAQEHGPVVMQMASAIRAANPQMSRADAIKLVGSAVCAHFGLPVQQSQARPAPRGNGQQQRGFVPARPGARVGTQQVDAGANWDALGMDFENG